MPRGRSNRVSSFFNFELVRLYITYIHFVQSLYLVYVMYPTTNPLRRELDFRFSVFDDDKKYLSNEKLLEKKFAQFFASLISSNSRQKKGALAVVNNFDSSAAVFLLVILRSTFLFRRVHICVVFFLRFSFKVRPICEYEYIRSLHIRTV